MRVTFSRALAQRKLDEARQTKTLWPEIAYLSDLHPMIEWLTDKVLLRVPRQQAPVITADVDRADLPRPGRLLQRARPAHGGGVDGGHRPAGRAAGGRLTDALAGGQGRPGMVNTAPVRRHRRRCRSWCRPPCDAARAHLEARRAGYDATVDAPIEEYRARLATGSSSAARRPANPRGRAAADSARDRRRARPLTESLHTAGEPLLRVLAVLACRYRRPRKRAPDELRLDRQPRRLLLAALPGRGAAPRPGEAGQPAHPLGATGQGEPAHPGPGAARPAPGATSTPACFADVEQRPREGDAGTRTAPRPRRR